MIRHRGPLLQAAVPPLEGDVVAGLAESEHFMVAEVRATDWPQEAVPVVIQVDVPDSAGVGWSSRREVVGDALQRVAAGLAERAGFEVERLLISGGAIAARADQAQIEELDADPEIEVALVELDPLVTLTTLDGVALDIDLASARQVDPELTGKDVKVAVLDSGIDARHPALRVSDAVAVCDEGQDPPGDHGTHCAGIVASRDATFGGVAPHVELVDIKVLRANGTGRHTWIVAGIDAALDREVDICSMSVGFNHLPVASPGGHGWACPDGRCPMCLAVDTATIEGMLMVVAAGNEHARAERLVSGGQGTAYDTELGCPGQAATALTVGAHAKATFAPASFSSTGPTAYGVMKPDLVAPGEQVLSTIPLPADGSGGRTVQFGVKSGTSMATPAVAGACALILQDARRRNQPTDPAAVKDELFLRHVVGLGGPVNVVGRGRLQLGF